ncbi:MAG: hypothetical protein K6E16_02755 [Lachnospiraceae bacterium]|nr:hypothetical protein [Lachnospiraceae bacterium]
MKKTLALIAAILLVLLYILTLVFAIIDSPFTRELFFASVSLTIALPVMIFVIRWFRNVLKLYFRNDRGSLSDDPGNGSSAGANGMEKK